MAKKEQAVHGLKSRHIELLALGGTIGTGLFLGSGRAIHVAGPAILLAYLITGVFCWGIMRALGELLLSNLKYHSFMEAIRDYLGERVSFIIGWAYWACWVALAMAEITAIGLYFKLWLPQVPQWLPGLLTLIVLLCLNLMSVSKFGEFEFWFSMIKVLAIVVLIVIGVGMVIFRFHSTDSVVATPVNLVKFNGFFATGWHGFLLSFQMVVFAYVGIEMVGVTAAEAENPKLVIPRVINRIPLLLTILYVGALVVVMCIYPWNRLLAGNSPFVLVFRDIGLTAAAGIVNFIVLTAAASACNSSLYTTGRMLAELTASAQHNSIRQLSRLSNRRVPSRAVIVSALVVAVASILNFVMPAGVFTFISSIATTSFLFVWMAIIETHLKYLKAQPRRRQFKMPGAPLTDYLIFLFLFGILGVLCLDHQTLIALILTIIWFIILAIFSRRQHKQVN